MWFRHASWRTEKHRNRTFLKCYHSVKKFPLPVEDWDVLIAINNGLKAVLSARFNSRNLHNFCGCSSQTSNRKKNPDSPPAFQCRTHFADLGVVVCRILLVTPEGLSYSVGDPKVSKYSRKPLSVSMNPTWCMSLSIDVNLSQVMIRKSEMVWDQWRSKLIMMAPRNVDCSGASLFVTLICSFFFSMSQVCGTFSLRISSWKS